MMLVPDDRNPETRVACCRLGDGPCVALDAPAFAAYRAGLTPEQQAALHVIWIPAKMGHGRKGVVMGALVAPGQGLDIGAYQIALLRHNILAWDGPGFGGVPATPEAIDRLDPDEPLAAFVLEEIARRNPLRRSPDPKSAGASGSRVAGAPPSTASSGATISSATTTCTSGLPSGSAGDPGRSTPVTPTTSTS